MRGSSAPCAVAALGGGTAGAAGASEAAGVVSAPEVAVADACNKTLCEAVVNGSPFDDFEKLSGTKHPVKQNLYFLRKTVNLCYF